MSSKFYSKTSKTIGLKKSRCSASTIKYTVLLYAGIIDFYRKNSAVNTQLIAYNEVAIEGKSVTQVFSTYF